MGSTQSKPISTQFSTCKDISKCMKHCENANGMKCKWNAMHDHIASETQHPTQKFHKKLINFQKPQKPKNLGLNA